MRYRFNNDTVAYFKIRDMDIGNAVVAYYIVKDTGYSCFQIYRCLLHNHTNSTYKKGALVLAPALSTLLFPLY